MEKEKISEIINSLEEEINSLRDEMNSSEHVICMHVVCDTCNQQNLEINSKKDSLMIQIREKEILIHKLQS